MRLIWTKNEDGAAVSNDYSIADIQNKEKSRHPFYMIEYGDHYLGRATSLNEAKLIAQKFEDETLNLSLDQKTAAATAQEAALQQAEETL